MNLIRHLIKALFYAWDGLKVAVCQERAFQIEVGVTIAVIPLAFWLGRSWEARALLIMVWLLVPIVELVNSSLETAVNRMGTEHHLLSKRAKDLAAAAVLLALLNAAVVWGFMLLSAWR